MESLTEELTCVICFDLFDQPVTLSCGHTFCKDCVKGVLINTSKCPFCQNIILSPNFQTNIVIQKLVDKFQAEQNPEEGQKPKKKKKKIEEDEKPVQKIIAFDLMEHKFTFDGTLYKLRIEFRKSKNLFLELLRGQHFAVISEKNKHLAPIFKLEGVQLYQRNMITLIARCQKRVKIECVENVDLTNSPYYIENDFLRPHEFFQMKLLSYQDRDELSNDLSDEQKQKLYKIQNKVIKLFRKLQRNNPHDYEILKIRHQVYLVNQQQLNIQYENNVQKYVEFLSQLLNLSLSEKEKLFLGESLDEKINIFTEYLDPITEQNDPVFVFYITQNLHKNSVKPFLILFVFLLFLLVRYLKNV